MELTMDNLLFPNHPSQSNNNTISASSSVLGDVDPDDQSTVSTPIAIQDDEKPTKKLNDPDSTDKGPSAKKPRHRHSPNQLAALNELYEKNEHPSLDDRTELAEKLGMETKTVNAWFQNKRASTKKRNKPTTSASTDAPPPKTPSSTLPSIANLLNSSSPPPTRNISSRSHPSSSSSRKKQKDILHHHHDKHINEPHDKPFAPEFLPHDQFVPENQVVDSDRHHAVYAERGHFVPDADSRFVSENDGASDGVTSRKGRGEPARNRTTPEQTEELRRAYARNAHPSKDEREELADRLGMRPQSVTNWFQNQRTQARKHKEDHPPLTSSSRSATADGSSHPSSVNDDDHGPSLTHLNFPPRASHPSLVPDRHLPPPSLPFLKLSPPELDEVKVPRSRMSLPPSSNPRLTSPRMRRSVTPYTRDPEEMPRTHEGIKGEDAQSRPRRSRPEPYQLEALKKLLHRTSTPSIEQRNALAMEVGMDIGKVTNWFRNIRQTARKRAKRAGVPLPRAPRGRGYQYNFSRETSSGSSSQEEDEDDAMDLDDEDTMEFDVDERSEEDFQEAVTPGMSPSPPPQKRIRAHVPLPMPRGGASIGVESMGVGLIEPAAFQELEMAVGMSAGPSEYVSADTGMHAATFSGVKIEDALLLLSFHQHVVH
ncbi:uncharacterized protein EDB93DRAFT_713678 [Suillus bovinus]|uniref:uncharacterized protein n=1 Tax=Suillus bovinus TaxID=48563 RepID=UPI001B86AA17|nr:uncharacterized protein EDB93DRAFT_713678 [Suillus bovinus]KAG2138701.1 hypothetical protein EDB93DRAFT_713678 [Suillus bovinus]